MKPIVNNFTGQYTDGTRYKLTIEREGLTIYVMLHHFIKGDWYYQSNVCGTGGAYLESLERALRSAEDKWGMKLLKNENELQKVS